MRNKNLLIFIGLLALIVILLTIWAFISKPVQKAPSVPFRPSPPPSFSFPSPVFSPSPPASGQVSPSYSSLPSLSEKVKEIIIANLPYETKGYSIQYLPNTDKFFILIKKNPYQQYKNQALVWFRGFGVANPEEELPLFFTSTRWVTSE